jgi:NTP pyrophosphatase (non-canonical NTP hydrolase)
MKDTLNELSTSIYLANKEKGFWDKERNVGELLMLVTSELGEAMEAHRKGTFANLEGFDKLNSPKGINEMAFKALVKDSFEDEIADAVIRLLDMSGGLGIDIGRHIELKLQYNKTREKLHGKNY